VARRDDRRAARRAEVRRADKTKPARPLLLTCRYAREGIAAALEDRYSAVGEDSGLVNTKDFDWSIIFRLNERLPEQASGRFAIFLDGNATIDFLTPDQLRLLNFLCGQEFFDVEYPKGSNPEAQSSIV
jgi:hypothetical protein